jgi:hypothetical protein
MNASSEGNAHEIGAKEASDRRGFLRRLGKMPAVGIGVAAVPAATAFARDVPTVGGCCPHFFFGCTYPTQPYRCYDSCVDMSCDVCIYRNPYECFTLPCACSGEDPSKEKRPQPVVAK